METSNSHHRQQLWTNLDKGRSFLISESYKPTAKVQMINVQTDGSPNRERCNESTGKMSFNQRTLLAQVMGGKPFDAKVTKYTAKAHKVFYTPQTDKMDGYAQYPRPICKPYANQVNYESQVSTRVNHQKQRKTLAMYLQKQQQISQTSRAQQLFSKQPDSQTKKKDGYFLHESLKDPRKEHDTKMVGDFFSGTAIDFRTQREELAKAEAASQQFYKSSTNFTKIQKTTPGEIREEILGTLDKLTGLEHKTALGKKMSVQRDEKPQGLESQATNYSRPKTQMNSQLSRASKKSAGDLTEQTKPKKQFKGVSQRFNQKADPDSMKTFSFVGPASTSMEKMLAVRAKMLSNKKGVKVNSRDLPEPPAAFIDKLSKTAYGKGLNSQTKSGSQTLTHDEEERTVKTPLKFAMRDNLQLSLQKRSNIPKRAVLQGITPSLDGAQALSPRSPGSPLKEVKSRDTNLTQPDSLSDRRTKTQVGGQWANPYMDMSAEAKIPISKIPGEKITLNDLFKRSHIQGFPGIKNKYTRKAEIEAKTSYNSISRNEKNEISYATQLYRSLNATQIDQQNQTAASTSKVKSILLPPTASEKYSSQNNLTASPSRDKAASPRNLANSSSRVSQHMANAMSQPVRPQNQFSGKYNYSNQQGRMVRSYFNKDIDISDTIRSYRKQMKEKFAEGQVVSADGSKLEKEPTGKPTSKNQARDKKAEEQKKKEEEEKSKEEDLKKQTSLSEIDSMIEDSEDVQNFTEQVNFMKGAPISPDLLDHLDNMDFPTHNLKIEKPVTNMTATKTAFQANKMFKDFEYKKENLMENIRKSQQTNQRELRARTKGRFPEHVAHGPAENYFRDMAWLKKANPHAVLGLDEKRSSRAQLVNSGRSKQSN